MPNAWNERAGQQLGGLSEFSPPYLDPTTKGAATLHGVNYASGGGGILNFTGKIFVSLMLRVFMYL